MTSSLVNVTVYYYYYDCFQRKLKVTGLENDVGVVCALFMST